LIERNRRQWAAVSSILILGLVSGCSSAGNSRPRPHNIDPLQKVNRLFYNFNDALDRHLLKPTAGIYEKIIPELIRKGIGNGFDNLGYLNVALNDFLQAKWGQGLSDTGRFAVNTTFGIAGIFDVATRWGLPEHYNSAGVTMGKWGFGPGPYLVLPLLGPYTLRDVPNIGTAMVTNPLFWIQPGCEVTLPLGIFATIDARSRSDFMFRFRSEAALDPYVFTRDAYIQYREAQIHEGKRPVEPGLYDDEESAPAPSTTAATQRR
jgi:phospholipid-binding lipoprotein MlaA